MKVTDVVQQIDVKAVISKIMDQYASYPTGSLSPREIVRSLNFNVSREEAEAIVTQLDTTITSAIMDFKYDPKKK